jgi:hypothetical protein
VQDGSTGSELDWDPDGTIFTDWVRRITAAAADPQSIGTTYAGMPPARYMKWWAAPDRNGADQSLDQIPAAVAVYRTRVRAAPLP